MHRLGTGFALAAALVLAGCGDPLQDVQRLDDVSIDDTAGQAEVVQAEALDTTAVLPDPVIATEAASAEAAPRRGLLGFLRRQAEAGMAEESAGPEGADAAGTASVLDIASEDDLAAETNEIVRLEAEEAEDLTEEAPVLALAAEPVPAATRPRRGLLGLLAGNRNATPDEDADADSRTDAGDDVLLAALPDATTAGASSDAAPAVTDELIEQAASPEPRVERRGLFGRRAAVAPGTGPDSETVTLGTSLPYGEVARVCNVSPRDLGEKVESYPERGRGYTLFDSAPGGTHLRPFFLTGFKDGCARQFSAALVLFGDPETWEQIHYGAAGAVQPTSETDKAYEKVKSKVCKVRAGNPCGAQMKTLARSTVFVSVYERFEDNPRWKIILLHDGALVAVDIKN